MIFFEELFSYDAVANEMFNANEINFHDCLRIIANF